MKYEYSMEALRVYSRTDSVSYGEMAGRVKMSPATFYRYVREERMPDIDALVRICNGLRVSINLFFHHPQVEIATVRIYDPDEFMPVKFRPEVIEKVRAEKSMSKAEFLHSIKDATGTSMSYATYDRLVSGQSCGTEFVLAVLNAFDLELSLLFEDMQLPPVSELTSDVLVSRATMKELREYVKELEGKNRSLRTENAALRRRDCAVATGTELPQEVYKRIRMVVGKLEMFADDLRGFLPESLRDETLYDLTERESLTAAESERVYERKLPVE